MTFGEHPTCPHCQQENPLDGDEPTEGVDTMECYQCERRFLAEPEYSVSFESSCLPGEHNWVDATTKLAQSQGVTMVQLCLRCDARRVMLLGRDHWEPRHLGQEETQS